jgi:uncharacterized protein YndB with AHSA1/START domain
LTADRFDAGALAAVRVEPAGSRWTLVFVRDLRHPPAKVWAALTDPRQLQRWAPFTASRDLAATGEATLTMIDGEQRVDLPATVTRSEPPALLEHTWGDDVLRWELEATAGGRGTRLTLRHTVDDRSMLPKVAAGWHLCLVVADRLLAGHPIDPIVGEDARNYGWDALHDEYAAQFGVAPN